MDIAWLLIGLAAGLSLAMAGAWVAAVTSGRSGWIDAIWSFAVGAGGVASSLVPIEGLPASHDRQLLVATLAGVWSVRLGLHIVQRTLGGGDDPRYAQLKRDWGDRFISRLFAFLQIQAAVAFLLAVTLLIAAHNPTPGLRLQDWLGVGILVIAIAGETVADRQLAAFKRDPKNTGTVCDVGLWGLSRHPNYFFEWLGWLAYAVIAVDASYSWGWAALAGPAFMYWLLVHASGVPPLEAHMLRSRPVAFRAYQARVNAFWPGPARKGHPSQEATS